MTADSAGIKWIIKRIGAVAFRHKQIKNRGIVKKHSTPCDNKHKFEEIRVENLWFSSFFVVFYSFSVPSLSMYVYTPSGRERRILL